MTSTSSTAPELKGYLRSPGFNDLPSSLSSPFVTPSLSSPAALTSTIHSDTRLQQRSASPSASLKVLYNPSTRTHSFASKETACPNRDSNGNPILTALTPPRVVSTVEKEKKAVKKLIPTQAPPADPKTFEILFVYDNMTDSDALSCNPSFAIGQQFILSAGDLFISSVEWRIRKESRQHFLIIKFNEERGNRRVFILAEGVLPGKDIKEGAALLSGYGRSLKRLDWQLAQGKRVIEWVEMKNVSSTSQYTEVSSERHHFIRGVNITSQSFNLIQLAILTDVAVRYCPYYTDLPSLSLWLTTITYCLIKQKIPLQNMRETFVDGRGRLFKDFKCCGYESSLLRPNSKKQLPYYLRKFDKATTKFMEEAERKENGITPALASSNSGQQFGLFKSPTIVQNNS